MKRQGGIGRNCTTRDRGWTASCSRGRTQTSGSIACRILAWMSAALAPRFLSEFCPNSRPTGADLSVRQPTPVERRTKKRPNSLGLIEIFWSGREDSNLRPLGPEPSFHLNYSEENVASLGSGNCWVTIGTPPSPTFADRNSPSPTSPLERTCTRRSFEGLSLGCHDSARCIGRSNDQIVSISSGFCGDNSRIHACHSLYAASLIMDMDARCW